MEEMLSPISVEIDTGHPHALVLRVSGEVDISTVGTIRRGIHEHGLHPAGRTGSR